MAEETDNGAGKVLDGAGLLDGINGDAYLGDRDTVEALVQLLLSDAVDDLKQENPAALTQTRVSRAAMALLGHDPNHQPMPGWNTENGGIGDWLRANFEGTKPEDSDQEVVESVLWFWIEQVYDLISSDQAEDSQPAINALIDQAANILLGIPAMQAGEEPDMLDGTPDSHPMPPEPPAEEPDPLEQSDEPVQAAESLDDIFEAAYQRWRSYP